MTGYAVGRFKNRKTEAEIKQEEEQIRKVNKYKELMKKKEEEQIMKKAHYDYNFSHIDYSDDDQC